jgi:Cwf15/Cwc15 cell cycle control protein
MGRRTSGAKFYKKR